MQHPLPVGPFDIIVLDPPYAYAALEDAVSIAGAQRAPGGIVFLDHAARVPPPMPPGLTLTRTVKSGDSALSMYS